MIKHVTLERAVYIQAELRALADELGRYFTVELNNMVQTKSVEVNKPYALGDAFNHATKAADAATRLVQLLEDQA